MEYQIPCKCGDLVVADQMVTPIEIGVPEPNVVFVVRRFIGTCPKCGPIHYEKVGHHDTIGKKEMERDFPIHKRRQIRNALSPAERKLFKFAMEGKREPTEEEKQRWLDIQSSVGR